MTAFLYRIFFFDRPGGLLKMSEAGGANIEVAQRLSERKESSQFLGHEILEIVEAVVLPVVCYHYCLERLSGSALDWTSVRTVRESEQTARSAERAAAYANQERLYNASTVVEWLKVEAHRDKEARRLI
jgi:hypothetical protein